MAKKKKGLVSFVKKFTGRKNPEGGLFKSDILESAITYVAPAATGYIVTRSAGRLATNTIGRKIKSENGLKMLKLGSNAAAFVLLWILAENVQRLRKYKSGVIAGSGIAAIQTFIELVLPKFAWLFDSQRLAPRRPVVAMDETEDDSLTSIEGSEDSDVLEDAAGVDDDELQEMQTGIFAQ